VSFLSFVRFAGTHSPWFVDAKQLRREPQNPFIFLSFSPSTDRSIMPVLTASSPLRTVLAVALAASTVVSPAAASAAFVPVRVAVVVSPSASSATSKFRPSYRVRLAATQWDNPDDNKKDTKGAAASAAAGGFDLEAISGKLQSAFQDFDLANVDFSGFQSLDLDTIKDNVMGGGQFGERGEAYFAAQAVVMLCVVLGGIPLVGDFLMLLLGPGLLLAGLGVAVISVKDLGSSLSPWPKPASTGELKTDGLYAYVRHPMYAGALAACAGLSIVTGSATRLLLTAVLLYVLDVKSDYEEAQLIEAYPGYKSYQAEVTNKFFPQAILDQMPWMNKN
jgi:protein-S-isoprenylcysteine O-methyltransferase Ste14